MPTPRSVRVRRLPLVGCLRYATLVALASLSSSWVASQNGPVVNEVQLYDPVREAVVATLEDDAEIELVDLAERRGTVRVVPSEGVASVAFAVDGRTVAIADGPPFELPFDVDADGRLVFPEARASATTVDVAVDSGTGDVEEFVRDSSDDPSAYPRGYTYTRSSDVELGHDPDHAPQTVALRFTGVEVPPGATVSAATVRFTADGDSSGPLRVTVRGEASPDAAPFAQDEDGTGSGAIAARATTVAETTWAMGDDEPWSDGETYRSPDLSTVVQEIVDQEAWRSGAALTIVFSEDPDGLRRARSYDAAPDDAPRIEIAFQPPPSSLVHSSGTGQLTITPYDEPAGGGTAGTPIERSITVIEGASAASAPTEDGPDIPEADAPPAEAEDAPDLPRPDPESEGEPPEEREPDAGVAAAPEADPAPEAEPAPQASTPTDAPSTRLRFPLRSSDDESTMGSTLLSFYPGIAPLLTVQVDLPFRVPIALEVRSRGCGASGTLVAALTTVSETPGLIAATADVAIGTLLAGDFGVHVVDAETRTSLACSALSERP